MSFVKMKNSFSISNRKSVFCFFAAFGLTALLPSLWAQQNKTGTESPQTAWTTIQQLVKEMETAVPSKMLACCQGLQGLNCEITKAKTAFGPVLVAIQVFAIGHRDLSDAPKGFLPGAGRNTGPPSAGSFLEIVLRRSLPENAPPHAS
jgi:hypothetical protein